MDGPTPVVISRQQYKSHLRIALEFKNCLCGILMLKNFSAAAAGCTLVMTFLLATAVIAEPSPLVLNQYRWTVGGHFSAPITLERPSSWNWQLEAAPRAGFFVIKNLEIIGQVGIKTRLYSTQSHLIGQGVIWSLGTGAIYYFDTPTIIHPYAGALAAYSMQNNILFSAQINVEVPLGIMLAVSQHCAIDVGMPVSWDISVRSAFTKFTVNPAYLGIRVFF
jgi:hypothetical protein